MNDPAQTLDLASALPSELALPDFAPKALWRNPHLQSILASSGWRARVAKARFPGLLQAEQRRVLQLNQGVRLSGYHARHAEPKRLAILQHGWEGSAHSSYLLSLGGRLFAEGWDVFRLNLRDHGDSHGLNTELFHSCRLQEVVDAMQQIRAEYPKQPAILGGFSLGGNFALRVARALPGQFDSVFAICPPLVPQHSLAQIHNAPWFYHYYFMRKWRASLRRKQQLFPHLYDFREWLPLDMTALTARLVQQQTQFASAEAYLDGYSIGNERLLSLRCPTLIIAAADDPVIPVRDFHELARPNTMRVEVLPYGGHCGFLRNTQFDSWVEARVLRELAKVS
jgi:uncharacterized protein